jgi:hypothetical protein
LLTPNPTPAEIRESIARGQFQAAARRLDAARRAARELAGVPGPLAADVRANVIAWGERWAAWMDEAIERYPAGAWVAERDERPAELVEQFKRRDER